jgi:transcription elongation factor Elf1
MSGVSMRGSGIDGVDYTAVFYCDNCHEERVVDGTTNDERTVVYATCRCGREMEMEIPEVETDYSEYQPEDYLE